MKWYYFFNIRGPLDVLYLEAKDNVTYNKIIDTVMNKIAPFARF